MKIVRVCAIPTSHPFRRRSFTAPTSEPRSRRRYTHPRWRSQPPSSLPGNWNLRHRLIQRSRYLRATTSQAEVRRSAITHLLERGEFTRVRLSGSAAVPCPRSRKARRPPRGWHDRVKAHRSAAPRCKACVWHRIRAQWDTIRGEHSRCDGSRQLRSGRASQLLQPGAGSPVILSPSTLSRSRRWPAPMLR
jgi:hypothetical protein